MKIFQKNKVSIALTIVMLIYTLSPLLVGSKILAADPLTDAEIRFYRLTTATAASGTNKILVKFTPGTVATQNEVRITFAGDGTAAAASYGVDATGGGTAITTSVASMPAGCNDPTITSNQASGVSGAVVDFGTANLTEGTTYCFFITAGITSPTNAGSYVNRIALLSGSNVVGEYTDVSVAHIANDQVVISATVPPSFTFALGANTTSFTTNLSTSARTYTTGVTGTVTTNSGNGWTAYLKSTNGGLDSALTGDTIDTSGTINNAPSTAANGAEHYLLDVDETSDAGTNGSVDAEYNGDDSTTGGTFNDTDLEAIASGTAATSNYVFTMKGLATISATTEASNDYTDTWTVVAAANF
jgi:hypothetical protein